MNLSLGDFLKDIKTFRRGDLHPVQTRVTTPTGEQLVENRNTKGGFSAKRLNSHCLGYVGDYRPDLQVGVVLPGLLLSSQDVAQEKSLLQQYGVTHILNCATNVPNEFESSYIYKNVDILDLPNANISMFFDGCFQFIDDGRQVGCTLVHCNAGVSRSATIVIAYLMNRENMRLHEAFFRTSKARPGIRPNEGFWKQLYDYDIRLFGSSAKANLPY